MQWPNTNVVVIMSGSSIKQYCFVDPTKAYYEISNPAGEALDFLTIQVRVQDVSGLTWIADGIG